MTTEARPIGWRDHAAGAGLGASYVVWLLATAGSLGFARDEGFYFRAGRQYVRWYDLLLSHRPEAFEQGTIDSIFSNNHEHPPLAKSLFGLSWEFFHEKWHVFSDASTALRFPGMVWAGIALWVTYLLGARAYGRWAGVVAAALLGLMPRVFYHAHLACFDVPMMSMWTLSVYVYWRATQKRTMGWAVLCGIVFGLALLTKLNAWFLPIVYVVHATAVHHRPFFRNLAIGRVTVPGTLVAMAVLGPLVFYAGWPWIWNDTVSRVREYVEFHLHHEYYNMEFLGKNYNMAPSPRSYMPVMILATVPAVTLALAGLGAFDRLRVLVLRVLAWARAEIGSKGKSAAEARPAEEAPPAEAAAAPPADAAPLAEEAAPRAETVEAPRVHAEVVGPGLEPQVANDRVETDFLFFLALCAPLAVFLLPATPIFGGTKHWMPAYPFLAVFAGRGFVITLRALQRAWPRIELDERSRLGAGAALAFLLCLGPFAITAHSHPFGLSSYVPLVGGTAGGADLGLNRQFWGFTTQSVGPWLGKNAPPHASVFIHDTAWDSWQEMLDEGRIRSDLRGVGSPGEADFALVQHELHMNEIDYEIWVAYGSDAPAYVLTHDNVPIVSVYRRQ